MQLRMRAAHEHTKTPPRSMYTPPKKPGVSGAGRAAKEANLYVEIAEGIHAYGVGSHRHMPEIEQGLSDAAGKAVTVSFTPHLMPMSRCVAATVWLSVFGRGLGCLVCRQEHRLFLGMNA
jgi:N-acetyl-gamma-glutamylphosphate reductase